MTQPLNTLQSMQVTKRDGSLEALSISKIQRAVSWACEGLNVSQSDIETSAHLPMYEGVRTEQIQKILMMTAADKISVETPDYTFVAARFLLQTLYKHANNGSIEYPEWGEYAYTAIELGLMDPRLNDGEVFDLYTINMSVMPEKDFNFDYLGLQTLADRYLLKDDSGSIIELPQHFLMRVAMGVALAETTRKDRTEAALSYYSLYSERLALNSTPTLFNSGTLSPQLSSCFGTYIGDSLDSIMDGMKENAQYSKLSGGCSADFGSVRAQGSKIGGTKGKAGGPIPYLKLFNDVLIGFDQSGKRKGSGSTYIEPWHADIQSYLKLREPGDDRLRAHDIFPALWIPDLFMEREASGGVWSLFDPKVVPELHESHGKEFREHYLRAEKAGLYTEQVDAEELWIEILGHLYTRGVYWPCFKDTVNARYAQPEMIHQSNLCTEICLRNDEEHSFVCNLGSINMSSDAHLLTKTAEGDFLWNPTLERTTRIMVRNLDSVISVGKVPHPKGVLTQQEDRPLGLGVMGWAEALYKMGIDYESEEHVIYANEAMKQITLTAIDESANLAQKLGSYPTFERSKWAQGLLPVDTLQHHRIVQKFNLDITTSNAPFGTMDDLRAKVKKGMRNSTLTAIAPTATIANILATTPCTELPWDETFTKKNLSGTFKYLAQTVTSNPYGLPFKSAKDVDQLWTVWAAAARQIWLCQSQSTNYSVNPAIPEEELGDSLREMYREAWLCGLKTSYYLHGQADQAEVKEAATELAEEDPSFTGGRVCDINAGPDCEACQ